MSSYPHPLIAREGWPFLAGAVVLVALFQTALGWVWSWPLWLIALFVLQFFRDPPRATPAGDRLILAPADGKIVAITQCHDPYQQRPALKISVFMNVFNVHSNRSPMQARVRAIHYQPGAFLNANLDKASEQNERNALLLENHLGQSITCVQVAGLIARRILCYVHEGQELAPGQRYGFIRFGSRVDLYLPPEASPLVAIGDKVRAASSVLAEWLP